MKTNSKKSLFVLKRLFEPIEGLPSTALGTGFSPITLSNHIFNFITNINLFVFEPIEGLPSNALGTGFSPITLSNHIFNFITNTNLFVFEPIEGLEPTTC